jgi:hypothetical protein
LPLTVELSVLNPGTCAHHLNIAGNDTSRIPQVVAMAYCAVAHIGDDSTLAWVCGGKPPFGAITSSFQMRNAPQPVSVCAGEK